MYEWFGSKGLTWQLCYRASKHGWNGSDFHNTCDNKGPTITLVKVDDYIFGGFVDVDWRGNFMRRFNLMVFNLQQVIRGNCRH